MEPLQGNAILVCVLFTLVLLKGLLCRLDSLNQISHKLEAVLGLLGIIILDKDLLGRECLKA